VGWLDDYPKVEIDYVIYCVDGVYKVVELDDDDSMDDDRPGRPIRHRFKGKKQAADWAYILQHQPDVHALRLLIDFLERSDHGSLRDWS
jgi:hypothetical protein